MKAGNKSIRLVRERKKNCLKIVRKMKINLFRKETKQQIKNTAKHKVYRFVCCLVEALRLK